MALGYGYVKRDEPQQIDWGTIGKEMTDFIKSNQESRTKRKEEIQNQYSDFTKSLIDKPVGYNTDLNDVISSYTNQASIAALNNLNKLKSGEISEREYYNKRANLKSSTENFFLYSKNFNSKLDENMKLAQSQDPNKRASGKMIFEMGLAQDMFDFRNTKAIIDPITDELILVKTDENGIPTNEVVNVSQLGTLSSQQELEYNYRQQIADRLEGKGARKTRDKNGREVVTILGAEINSQTAKDTIDTMAESLLGDESQTLSILYQNGYKYTQDESLKGKDGYIYYDIKNGTYDVDPAKAKEILVKDITSSIPETVLEPETVTVDTSKQIEDLLRIQKLQEDINYSQLRTKKLQQEMDLDPVKAEAALNTYFQNNKSGIQFILENNELGNKDRANQTVAKLQPLITRFNLKARRQGNNIVIDAPMYSKSGQILTSKNSTEQIDLNTPIDDIFTYIQNWIVSSQVDPIDKKKGIQGLIIPETQTETETVEVDYENL